MIVYNVKDNFVIPFTFKDVNGLSTSVPSKFVVSLTTGNHRHFSFSQGYGEPLPSGVTIVGDVVNISIDDENLLGPGSLVASVACALVNSSYPDGYKRWSYSQPLGIVLVRGSYESVVGGSVNGIESIHVLESLVSGGENKVTIKETNGSEVDFIIRNGVKGDKGDQGNSGYSGAAGELEVVNNLTDGGETSALSAEQGKVLKAMTSEYTYPIIDVSVGNNTGAIVPAAGGHTWSNGTSYKGRCFDVSDMRGWRLHIRHGESVSICSFAFLNATPVNGQPISYCDGETIHSDASEAEVIVPDDATLLYVQRLSSSGVNITPIVEILTKDKETMYGLIELVNTVETSVEPINGLIPFARLPLTVNTGTLKSNGTINTGEGFFQYSDYIDIHEFPRFYYTGRLNVSSSASSDTAICFYDSNKTLVRGATMRDIRDWDGTTGVKTLTRRALRTKTVGPEYYVRVSNVPSPDYPTPIVEVASTLRTELDEQRAAVDSLSVDDYPHTYEGMPITINPQPCRFLMRQYSGKSDFAPSNYDNFNQGGAYYNGYYFRLYNKMELVDVYDANNRWERHTAVIDYNGYDEADHNHANSCGFGGEFHTAGDDFPLLYVSRGNADNSHTVSSGGLDVYRVQLIDGTFSLTLVQRITGPNKNSFAINADGAGDTTFGARLRRIKIPYPPIVKKRNQAVYQSGFIKDGIMYLTVGGADWIYRDEEDGIYKTDHSSGLWLIDLALGARVSEIKLWEQGMTAEPEASFIHNGTIFVDTAQYPTSSDSNTAYGGLWQLLFPPLINGVGASASKGVDIENSQDYLLLRASDGSVWRLEVGTDGELSTTPLS